MWEKIKKFFSSLWEGIKRVFKALQSPCGLFLTTLLGIGAGYGVSVLSKGKRSGGGYTESTELVRSTIGRLQQSNKQGITSTLERLRESIGELEENNSRNQGSIQ